MYMVFRGLPRGIFFCLLGMAVRLAALAAAAAAAALAAVLLVSSSQRPAALLQQRRRGPTSARGLLPARRGVRAPGDDGVGGHGIGGEICWYEITQVTGLGEWTCPQTEETLAAAKGLKPRPLAQMLRMEVEKYGAAGCNYECDDDAMLVHQCGWTCPPTAELPPIVPRTAGNSYFSQAGWTRPSGYWGAKARTATLFDFGNRAPSEGYAAAYASALPPMDWGDNYDGKNFFAFYPEEQDFTGMPAYAKLDGDYWEAVHGGVPTPLPFDLEEVLCVCARTCACVPCARVLGRGSVRTRLSTRLAVAGAWSARPSRHSERVLLCSKGVCAVMHALARLQGVA